MRVSGSATARTSAPRDAGGAQGKEEQKEQKEKEQKEQKEKEQKEKEQEGGKSFVKLEKNEFKEMLEQGQPQTGPEDAASGLEARVTEVEDAVAKLRHFISPGAAAGPDCSRARRARCGSPFRYVRREGVGPMALLLERELAGLLIASRMWANHRPVNESRVREARDAALIANHRRYVASVPVYSRLAAELGHSEVEDVATIIDELLVGVSLFKSYDDALLAGGDFAGLTAWVGEVSTLAPEPCLDGVASLDDWRVRMQDAGVFITVSSGTSGRPSLVPRDAATMTALRNNGRCYSMLAWGGYVGSEPDSTACSSPARAVEWVAGRRDRAGAHGRTLAVHPGR